MPFFRIKKIKGKEYAYIVQNEWGEKGSRQKVRGYAGRVYRFDLLNNVDFPGFLKIEGIQDYIAAKDMGEVIANLIEWEAFKFGINKDEFIIDLSGKKIQKNKKDIALAINDGFMCNLTLKNLLEFKPEGDEQSDGYRLARAFVEAGIKIPKEIFIGLFNKIS